MTFSSRPCFASPTDGYTNRHHEVPTIEGTQMPRNRFAAMILAALLGLGTVACNGEMSEGGGGMEQEGEGGGEGGGEGEGEDD